MICSVFIPLVTQERIIILMISCRTRQIVVLPSMTHNEEGIKEVLKRGIRCTIVGLRITV